MLSKNQISVQRHGKILICLLMVVCGFAGCASQPPVGSLLDQLPPAQGQKLPAVQLVMPDELRGLVISQRSLLVGMGAQPIQSDIGNDVYSMLKSQLDNHFCTVTIGKNYVNQGTAAVVIEDLDGDIESNDLSFNVRLRTSLYLPDGNLMGKTYLVGHGKGDAAKLFGGGALVAGGIAARAERQALLDIARKFEKLLIKFRKANRDLARSKQGQQKMDKGPEAVKPVAQTVAAEPVLKEYSVASGSNSANAAAGNPWIGLHIIPVTQQLAQSLGLPEARGAFVIKVVAESPSNKAGIKPGDIVTALDGRDVENPTDLVKIVKSLAVGQQTKIMILRSGKQHLLSITLAERGKGYAQSFIPASGFSVPVGQAQVQKSNNRIGKVQESYAKVGGRQLAIKYCKEGMDAARNARKTEDLQAAADSFSMAVETSPDWPVAYYNLGRVLVELDRPYGAIKAYQKYLDLAPNASNRNAVKARIKRLKALLDIKKRTRIPGVTFASLNNGIHVMHLLPGSRIGDIGYMRSRLGARAVALQKGDRIVAVNGKSVVGKSLNEFFKIIEEGIQDDFFLNPANRTIAPLVKRLSIRNPATKHTLAVMEIVRGGKRRYSLCVSDVFRSRLQNIEAEELKDDLARREGVSVVLFWANWCRPCNQYTPIVESVSESVEKAAAFYSVNVEQDKKSVKIFRIESIPTLVIYKNGKEKSRLTGKQTKQDVIRFLSGHL